MKVILADILGYCMGVRCAMEKAENALEKFEGKNVYSLGPLIHNENALNALKQKGLKILSENDFKNAEDSSVVIIRAHGVSPEVLKVLEEKKCTIINATCPRVVASQKNAEKFSKKGFKIILAGDKNHGEVTGIQGYAGSKFNLVENVSDALNFSFSEEGEASVLLSQTTFSPGEFEKISQILSEKNKKLKILNTICPATKERQDSLFKLCEKVDGILVVGGKKSANTKRLLESAKKICKKADLIEDSSEIKPEFFNLKTVGITAGASTPDSVIQEVKNALEKS